MNKTSGMALPGANVSLQAAVYSLLILFLLVMIPYFIFITNFEGELNFLYEYEGTQRVISDGAVMPDVNFFTSGMLVYLPYVLGACVIGIALNYIRIHRNRSIYVLKRMDDQRRMHRMCLAIPVIAALAAIMAGGIMVAVCYGIYMDKVPEQCIPEDFNGIDLWRTVAG